MTQDEIIEMARQAGGMFTELPMMDAWVFTNKSFEAFAKLVAEAAAVKAVERGPVGWQICIGDSSDWSWASSEADADFYGKQSGLHYEKRPLYTTPNVPKGRQQRTFIGLTNEEAKTAWPNTRFDFSEGVEDVMMFARAIEAKLKEKNT